MKIKVHFWSGRTTTFDVVGDDMLLCDFIDMAVEDGGRIKSIEFPEE